MDLTQLTKDQLITALELYMTDVDKLLVEKEKSDNLAYEYESLYKRLNAHHKTALSKIEELEETVDQLYFQVKKHKALASAACMQAYEAKRKPCVNVNIKTVKVYQPKEKKAKPLNKVLAMFSGTNDQFDIDTNGLYSPRK